jgi:hypothetical protein
LRPGSSADSGYDVRLRNASNGGASFVSENATLLAVAWPLVLLAIFLPLSVHRYRHLSR